MQTAVMYIKITLVNRTDILGGFKMGNRTENKTGMQINTKLWKRAAAAALSAAALAGTVFSAVPVMAAGTGTSEYTSEGSARVAVTAEVPDRVTAEYTVVLPTGVKLEYDAGTGKYTGMLDAGVYGSIDAKHAVYTKIIADPSAPVDRDASGSFVEGVPDGTADTAGSITRWYRMKDSATGSTAYLTAEQDAGNGCIMEWVDNAHASSLGTGESVMAADSVGLAMKPLARLQADVADEGSYSGNVMVEFGVTKR